MTTFYILESIKNRKIKQTIHEFGNKTIDEKIKPSVACSLL